MTTQQTEALRLANVCSNLTRYSMDAHLIAAELRRQHARIADLEAQLEAIGAGGVSGPLIGQPQAMPDLSQLTERGAKAWAGVDAQGLREGFTAADMATVSAQGFRDGVASLSANAGEPRNAIDRDALIDAIARGLRGTWHCTRVWEAWHVGTMSQDDFEPVDESETPTEIADAVLALLAAPSAAQAVVDRWDTPLWKDVPATAEYIGRLRAALAAGQATAAQAGVVYAELPAPNYPKSGGFPGTFTEAQMRVFADATHALRAPHGQAPAKPDPAYSAACHLATALFKKHFAHLPDFASGQAVWGLCGSTAGVISQIDNMVAGLVQPPTTAFSEDEL